MRDENAVAARKSVFPVLFLDDWPQPAARKQSPNEESGSAGQADELELPGMNEVKRWRLQALLAVNPWGVPSLALSEAYQKMFNRPLDIKELGFEDLADMISKLADIVAVQEPDELTALLFPQYPHDRILHDARYGHQFDQAHSDALPASFRLNLASPPNLKDSDADTLNSLAWLNRDDDFPPDVVLAGEQYHQLLLPMSSASIAGSRGLYQAIISAAGNPDYIYLNIKSQALEKLHAMPLELAQYFAQCDLPMEMFSVPDEFIYTGFPCLVYRQQDKTWERAAIIKRSPKGNKVLVEIVDFGGTISVSRIHLYLMPRKFFELPRQALLVSLAAIKPANESQGWSLRAGYRVRCFSEQMYWIDCLLMEPKRSQKAQLDNKKQQRTHDTYSSSFLSSDSLPIQKTHDQPTSKPSRRPKQRFERSPQFDMIACDRNDPEVDIYLDEVLCMETSATLDESRLQEVNSLKQQLKNAFSNIPRPINPFEQIPIPQTPTF